MKSRSSRSDIKDRLLGHWGTDPGINLVYAHLNHLIMRYDLDMFLVTGPGHGAPANLANLYLEGTLHEYYPELTFDRAGLHNFVRRFSWPGGFPSHLYPGIPGTIHEGGELGYALATAFGAAMDNPDLIVACIVGDGEAETGPTATAWHSYKFLDPAESGAVLPILHLNGYKICQSYHLWHDERRGIVRPVHRLWLSGTVFVEGDDLDASTLWRDGLGLSLRYAVSSRRHVPAIPSRKPRWPVIVDALPSRAGLALKRWMANLLKVRYRSHQVPVTDVKTNPAHLQLVEQWLRSYHVEELFDRRLATQCQRSWSSVPKASGVWAAIPIPLAARLRQEPQLARYP